MDERLLKTHIDRDDGMKETNPLLSILTHH